MHSCSKKTFLCIAIVKAISNACEFRLPEYVNFSLAPQILTFRFERLKQFFLHLPNFFINFFLSFRMIINDIFY